MGIVRDMQSVVVVEKWRSRHRTVERNRHEYEQQAEKKFAFLNRLKSARFSRYLVNLLL
jgi:hypothetical protein